MKALKIIGIIVAVLIVLLLIIGLVAPKTYNVERTTSIDAPKEKVYKHVSSLKEMGSWSPWNEMDPDMKVSFEGTDGQVGSVTKWEGNEKVGKGEQEITALKANERVDTELRFIEPWEGKATSYITLADSDNGTDVSWGMNGNSPFPMNIMMLFMNMDKAIGADFEKGLGKLKKVVEESSSSPAYDIQKISIEAKTYIGSRSKVNFDGMSDFYGNQFGAMMGLMEAKKITMAGHPTGLYYTWDEEAKVTDMAPALPVAKAPGKLDKPFQVINVPASKALLIDYYGNYDDAGGAHYAMGDYLEANKLKGKEPVIEEYVTDPMTEPDTSKWLTKIYYLYE